MSEFDTSGSVQAAFDQIEALSRAASAAAGVTATVEHELVTVTMSAAPHLESVSYAWSSMRGVDSETLARATRDAVAEAVVELREQQVQRLQGTPLAPILTAGEDVARQLPPDVVDRARAAAADLAEQEHTASDAEGRVEVTVDGVGTITRLWLSATSTRESAAEWLPDAVRTTVNQALARARQAQESAMGDDGSAELEARLDEVVGAAEARLDGLFARLDEVSRRLDGLA